MTCRQDPNLVKEIDQSSIWFGSRQGVLGYICLSSSHEPLYLTVITMYQSNKVSAGNLICPYKSSLTQKDLNSNLSCRFLSIFIVV
ncbi:hypothetical protein SAY86_027449 [Trapa natans]|uniref:Uncharacterized protein n=1 Tax=Trapa natans TaxID=22666 RepID=A0AAN7KL76_TRANT|nr:hypothetical protein SAY86_027449 [Trapa natans]